MAGLLCGIRHASTKKLFWPTSGLASFGKDLILKTRLELRACNDCAAGGTAAADPNPAYDLPDSGRSIEQRHSPLMALRVERHLRLNWLFIQRLHSTHINQIMSYYFV